MRAVDELLVAGVGVGGGHQAVDDAERVVEHLHQRHEAVGGAARVRDDLVLLRLVVLVVDAVDDREVGTGRRGRHDDGRGTRLEVHRCVVTLGEEARRLDHDVDAEVAPRECLGVALGQHRQRVVADLDPVLGGRDLLGQHAHDRVVLEEVGHRVERAEVVHRDEVDVGAAFLRGTEEVAADAPEAVDAYANGHGMVLSMGVAVVMTPSTLLVLRDGAAVTERYVSGGPIVEGPMTRNPCDRRAQSPTSRCEVRAAMPCSDRRRASSSAMATERWRPPVQPIAIVR